LFFDVGGSADAKGVGAGIRKGGEHLFEHGAQRADGVHYQRVVGSQWESGAQALNVFGQRGWALFFDHSTPDMVFHFFVGFD